jgi:hypothetical protein
VPHPPSEKPASSFKTVHEMVRFDTVHLPRDKATVLKHTPKFVIGVSASYCMYYPLDSR